MYLPFARGVGHTGTYVLRVLRRLACGAGDGSGQATLHRLAAELPRHGAGSAARTVTPHHRPNTCVTGVCMLQVPRAPYKQTWQMNLSTIIQPCNNTVSSTVQPNSTGVP